MSLCEYLLPRGPSVLSKYVCMRDLSNIICPLINSFFLHKTFLASYYLIKLVDKWICVCFTFTEIGLVPTTIFLNSTTSKFSVFWNNPTTHYQLVSGYEVKWGVASFSTNSSGTLSRTVNQYTVSNNLIPGQLYRVNVISYITLTGPADSSLITSTDRTVRTGTEYDVHKNHSWHTNLLFHLNLVLRLRVLTQQHLYISYSYIRSWSYRKKWK